jgi:5-methylcytosine-specific restriction endonuclease McrA
MSFALFNVEIPAPGETQIRTEGLYVSSYANDGVRIPYLSTSAEEVLGQALRDKHRLENSAGCWRRKFTIEEPVVEASIVVHEPTVEPMPIARPQAELPPKILPIPAPDPEDHTAGLNELDDLVAYVAARSSRSEPTLNSAPPAAATRQATAEVAEETNARQGEACAGLVDTDNEKSALQPTESTGVTAPISAILAIGAQSPGFGLPSPPEAHSPLCVSNSLAVPGHHRKSPVRLTDKERETAIRLGLRPSLIAPTLSVHSVLDDFKPIKRTVKQSYGPSKNVLVKCVAVQDECCAYCDRLFGSLVLIDGKLITLTAQPDHFIPRAKRLNNSPSNIVAACQLCNRLKDSRVFTSIAQARAVLQAAWVERGWSDAPLLVPFKLTMPTCFN